MSIFSYDLDAPIELQERSRESVRGASLRDVTYVSPAGGDVSAYLVVPSGEGPFPGVLFLHWGAGDRSEFLAESLQLATAGAASLLIDAPHNRPGWVPFAFGAEPDKERDYFVQMVRELRRAVDVLVNSGFIDPLRLGYVGHSLGATVGGSFAAVEPRVGTFVLMGGLPRPTALPGVADQVTEAYEEIFSTISSEALVGEAVPGSIFLQFARYDRHISRVQAEAFIEAAGEGNRASWYVTGHEFNDQASKRERLQWLAERLQLDRSALRS